MSSGFEVITAGIQATVQDLGRVGLASTGVSTAGAIDEFSFNHANRLLGNDYGTNMLEILFGGVKLKATCNTHFILTGAKVDATINNIKIENWKTYQIKNGDILNIGFATSGARVYLSVIGGFDVKKEYGSYSVSIKEKLGGKPLHVGQILPYKKGNLKENRKLPKRYIPDFDKPLKLRVVAGYQWDKFEKDQQDKFFNSTYKVTNQSDRMGYRLSGEKITSTCKGIISEPIAYGSIQIPAHGEPIVLLKERQTIGGYPKIGSVIPVDCFRLSQAKPDSTLEFELVSLNDAQEINREFYNFFK